MPSERQMTRIREWLVAQSQMLDITGARWKLEEDEHAMPAKQAKWGGHCVQVVAHPEHDSCHSEAAGRLAPRSVGPTDQGLACGNAIARIAGSGDQSSLRAYTSGWGDLRRERPHGSP